MKIKLLITLSLFIFNGCAIEQSSLNSEVDDMFEKNKWVEINKDDSIKKGLIYEQQ